MTTVALTHGGHHALARPSPGSSGRVRAKNRTPTRPRIEGARQHRQHHAQELEGVGGDVEAVPAPQAPATAEASSRTTEPAVPRSRGTAAMSASSISAIIGTVTSTHRVITARAHGVSTRFSGAFQRCGRSPSRVGRIRW